MPRDPIVVIGAGVTGLTTAVCLAEAGLPVRVVSKDEPRHTLSRAAGAAWSIYLVDEHDDRPLRWGGETFRELERLSELEESGIRMRSGLEAHRVMVPEPRWAGVVRDFRADETGLPEGFAVGWRYTMPVTHMPTYLGYLASRLSQAGVHVELSTVDSLGSVAAETIVNCSGVGARSLVPDEGVEGIQGQLVVVENPGIESFFLEDASEWSELTYFMPHGDTVALGGSAVAYQGNLSPDPEITAGILARCAAIEPKLAGARVVEQRVGVRPVRPGVRLEKSTVDGRTIIHNYGHGGSGVTLSWGCAREVLSLVVD